MSVITYLEGDATKPILPHDVDDGRVIMHCCNDIGAWGSGFVVALSKRWKKPEARYRQWIRKDKISPDCEEPAQLGGVQLVAVDYKLFVANIIGQKGVSAVYNRHPVKYDALFDGFINIRFELKLLQLPNASIHAPRLGCGLAGGNWKVVEALIEEVFATSNHKVFIYDLPEVK